VTPSARPLPLDVQTAFVPVPMSAAPRHVNVVNAGVKLELQRNGAIVSIMWPTASLSESAAWVRAILR